MQVGADVKCMHTNFGRRGFSSFGDIATFKNGQISPSDHDYNKTKAPIRFHMSPLGFICHH